MLMGGEEEGETGEGEEGRMPVIASDGAEGDRTREAEEGEN